MVEPGYMLDKPAPPSPIKLFVNRRLIPKLIDAAASLESGIEAASNRARRAPLSTCFIMLGLGWSLGFLTAALRGSKAID